MKKVQTSGEINGSLGYKGQPERNTSRKSRKRLYAFVFESFYRSYKGRCFPYGINSLGGRSRRRPRRVPGPSRDGDMD